MNNSILVIKKENLNKLFDFGFIYNMKRKSYCLPIDNKLVQIIYKRGILLTPANIYLEIFLSNSYDYYIPISISCNIIDDKDNSIESNGMLTSKILELPGIICKLIKNNIIEEIVPRDVYKDYVAFTMADGDKMCNIELLEIAMAKKGLQYYLPFEAERSIPKIDKETYIISKDVRKSHIYLISDGYLMPRDYLYSLLFDNSWKICTR